MVDLVHQVKNHSGACEFPTAFTGPLPQLRQGSTDTDYVRALIHVSGPFQAELNLIGMTSVMHNVILF